MYLGIDLGTSSIKCLLIDDNQKTIASSSHDFTISTPKSGWAEQDPSFWINGLSKCLNALNKNIDFKNILSISFSGQMHGATCLNDEGKIIRPSILWNDTRSFKECESMMNDNPDIMDITGNLAMPGFTAPKIAWMREHEPENFKAIHKILLPKDYLRFHLSNEYFSDMSDASGTYWLNVGERNWSKKLLDLCDLTEDNMPQLCEGTEQTGVVSKKIAETYGFDYGCKIIGGAGDNAAGALGLGLISEGEGSISLGTSGVIFTPTSKFKKNYHDATHSFCHCIPDTWHLMTVMLSCTSNINWFTDTFKISLEDLFKYFEKKFNSDLDNCPYYLPYLTGERTPINDPFIRGSFNNIGLQTKLDDMSYSLIEGISFGILDNYLSLEKANQNLDTLYVIGGGSQNDQWLEMIATLLQKKLILTKESSSMAAFGAARIALIGNNNSNLNEVLYKPTIVKTISPNSNKYETLSNRFMLWKKIYESNKSLAPSLN
jgi:xylulokinase